MLPASNRTSGKNLCPVDVCVTPPGIPIPYLNIANHCQAVQFSQTTMVSMSPALNLGSKTPTTTGDLPGVLSKHAKQGDFIAGCPNVFIDGLQAINLTSPAKGNASNCVGAHVVPDAVNVYMNDARRAPGGHVMGAEEIAALCRDLQAWSAGAAMLPGGIGLLRIVTFTAELPTLVWNEIRRLEAEGLTALVIDLRGCPGGELDAAVRLAGDFLPRGAAIATVTDEDGDEVVHRARGEASYRMPVCVLVDGGTASAAEVFAGALQGNGRALVVGATTYGKGTVQSVVRCLEDGALRYATVARCALADGRALQGAGVGPDLEVPAGPVCSVEGEDLEGDAPLFAAWEIAAFGLAPGLSG